MYVTYGSLYCYINYAFTYCSTIVHKVVMSLYEDANAFTIFMRMALQKANNLIKIVLNDIVCLAYNLYALKLRK